MLLLEYLKQKKDFLKKKEILDFELSALEIISKILHIKKNDLFLQPDFVLPEDQIEAIDELIEQRANKVPLGYLISPISFYDCTLHLNEHVLIPRHETEILVDKIVQILKKEPHLEKKVFLDLCTGSGCIAIAIKKQFPHLMVFASDLSEEALKIAKKNAQVNRVEIQFVKGDGLTPFKNQKFDYIVSNPPYVSEEEYEDVSDEVKKEPKMALVPGKTGLEFYERLSHELPFYLNENAKIFFEIGYNQKEKIEKLFSNNFYRNIEVLLDFSHHPRFFFIEFNSLGNKTLGNKFP